MSLAELLRAEALAGGSSSGKSVINIHLDGGPPQHDTIDPKPEAPEEIRGEFRPISTKIPGFQISELMPTMQPCKTQLDVPIIYWTTPNRFQKLYKFE